MNVDFLNPRRETAYPVTENSASSQEFYITMICLKQHEEQHHYHWNINRSIHELMRLYDFQVSVQKTLQHFSS